LPETGGNNRPRTGRRFYFGDTAAKEVGTADFASIELRKTEHRHLRSNQRGRFIGRVSLYPILIRKRGIRG